MNILNNKNKRTSNLQGVGTLPVHRRITHVRVV